MESRKSRVYALTGGIAVLWVVTITVLLNVIPGPHQKTDYLVMGAVATFLSLLMLFAVLLQGGGGLKGIFYKEKPSEHEGEGEN